MAIGQRVYHSLNLTHLSACFAGRIPTELGQLSALTQLDLDNNQLTGECDHKTRLIAIGKRVYQCLVSRVCTWPVCIVCLVLFVRYRRLQEVHEIKSTRLPRYGLIVTSLCEREFKVHGRFYDMWQGDENPSSNACERAIKSNKKINPSSWQTLTDVHTQLPRHLTDLMFTVAIVMSGTSHRRQLLLALREKL